MPGVTWFLFTFDQPMSRGGHSIVGGGDAFPTKRGKPRWKLSRTIVIPVRLKPDHEYWLSFSPRILAKRGVLTAQAE